MRDLHESVPHDPRHPVGALVLFVAVLVAAWGLFLAVAYVVVWALWPLFEAIAGGLA